jgi:hypothetical protein
MSQTPPNPSSVPPAPSYGAPVSSGDGYQNPTPPYGGYQGGGYSPGTEPRYNVLAIVSFISAFFLSLVAVIIGHIALVVMAVLGVGLFAAAVNSYDDYSYTSDPSTSPDAIGGDLTFEAGNDLDANTLAQFADPFIIDPEWTVASPDDGNGNWSYLDPSGLCTVSFHQGTLGTEVPATAGDDRATSAEFLAVVLSTDASTIASKAVDSSISYNFEGAGVVDTLMMQGTDTDGSNWKLAGRAFGELGSGLYVDVTCDAGGDVESVYDTVTTKAAITTY